MPEPNDATPPEVEVEQLRIALDAAVEASRELVDELARQDVALAQAGAALRELVRVHLFNEPDAAALEQAAEALHALEAGLPHARKGEPLP